MKNSTTKTKQRINNKTKNYNIFIKMIYEIENIYD